MSFCPKKILILLSFLLIPFFVVSPALAAAPDGLGPWADAVVNTSQGLMKNGNPVPAIRSNPSSALGVAEATNVEGSFIALGFGGSITLGFDNGISNGAMVVEATNPGYPDETAKIEMSSDGVNWVMAGNLTDTGTVAKPSRLTCAKYVRITDTSNPNNFSEATADGYDVDGVKSTGDPCTPPPPHCTGTCGGCTSITQSNTTTIINGVTSIVSSGNNTENNNTGGSNVTSGSASSIVNITNNGSSSTATGGGCCPGGNTSVTIANNGAGSINTVHINSSSKKNKKGK